MPSLRIEGEPIRSETPRCPMCERELESIYDYPFVQITDLVVSRIPSVVEYQPGKGNVAEKIRVFQKMPAVQNYLKGLSLVKKALIKLEDYKPDLPEWKSNNEFVDSERGYYKLDGRYYLRLTDSDLPGVAKVSVFSHINPGIGWGFFEIAKLAEIKYQGVLNNPPEDLLRGMV